LSFAQERLWFLEQLEPRSAVYNICRAFRLTGKLNLPALESSLNEIVRRHEVLRSAIRVRDGRPEQVVEPAFEVQISVSNLRATSGVECREEIELRTQEAAATPSDFSSGRFLRTELLRVGDEDHILILATHHIVSDAWSMGILSRELWSLYESYAAGKTTTLRDLPIQYADFASWQREWLQGEMLESQLSYWKKQLHDIPILNLPTDRRRPAPQSFYGARESITLSQLLTTAINELSHRQSVTPFMTLLAAFEVLLHRYSGQDDVVVGSPIANRNGIEFESLIGFFVNTLVLRGDLSGDPPFSKLLSRIRDMCLGAYAHQDLPFEKLVQELQPERDLSRNPLFQVMFVLQNATKPLKEFPGLRAEPIEIDVDRSPFDLSLFLRERDGRFIGYFEYSTDLFERETIERMARHFERLLEGIVADPNQPISRLSLLTEAERHQILVEWNKTATEDPENKSIHELFEAQVERTPDAIALEFEGEEITYRELNRRANQVAHYLVRLGIGPEKLVGICVQRSIEMVVGLLGILKAGGAYVPLDPSYPKERLRFMLEDAQVSVLLTQEKLAQDRGWKTVLSPSAALRLNSVEGMENGNPRSSILDPRVPVVFLDRDLLTIERERIENPKSQIHSNNLAYVIYTSGSTGRPKGVAVEHRNTVALLHWARSVFTSEELAGVLASTSICFDLSVFELFLPLCSGGKVILVDNVSHLHSAPERDQVTLINTVPSAMTELLRMGELPDTIRIVNLAGEPLQTELVNKIYACGTIERIYDLYGPSETTTYSTFTLRTRDGPATIGRPISNTRVYILDGSLQPVPIGVPGELYIGGAGVARGYLNRPDLTAERFIQNPFNNEERLYRTGDRARYLLDGSIDFLGRADNQVKIRGYRIELGEIEAVLDQHPAVNDSVVATRARESLAEKSLIGYIVPKQHPAPSVVELRDYLKAKLPEYMIPSAFVMLHALPLMLNGKVDRQALPPPDDSRPQLEKVYVEPRTQVEELIAQIWREVLKLGSVGVHDNFFELGGHSLLAIQIISRVREVFDKDVPLLTLFEAPTVAGLAATIETTISDRSNELPPVIRVSRDGPLPLSMNQEHLWRLDQMIPGTHFFNMPYVYRFIGDLNVSALEKTLQEIIRRHEALRTVFAEVDGRPAQIIKEVPEFQLPDIDLRGESADEVSQKAAGFILEEREGPFDLASGPLLRTKLLRLTDKDYLLLVTMHHIISDHWSVQIFRRELAAIYQAFSQGQPSPLSECTIQSADFACWERGLIEKGLLEGQLSYWVKQLEGELPVLAFHQGRNVEQQLGFQTTRQLLDIDETLFTRIQDRARKERCTPFMVIIAALNILLHRHSGQRDIRIGTLVANRRQVGTEGVIGHFMNTVVLSSSHIFRSMTTQQLLQQVREVTLMAFAHQELPFEELARVLEQQRRIDRSSLIQVLINYQISEQEWTRISGLKVASIGLQIVEPELELIPTAFDLIFNLRESSTKLTGSVNFRTCGFDQDVITSTMKRFRSIIENIVMPGDHLILANLHDGVE